MQVLSVSYGVFAGLRGFLISILNTDLIQNLRCAMLWQLSKFYSWLTLVLY